LDRASINSGPPNRLGVEKILKRRREVLVLEKARIDRTCPEPHRSLTSAETTVEPLRNDCRLTQPRFVREDHVVGLWLDTPRPSSEVFLGNVPCLVQV